jgi:hypothetical protein
VPAVLAALRKDGHEVTAEVRSNAFKFATTRIGSTRVRQERCRESRRQMAVNLVTRGMTLCAVLYPGA